MEWLKNRHELNTPETQKPAWSIRKKLLVGVLALASVAGVGYAVTQPFDKTGKVGNYEPANPLPPKNDQTLGVASWNMHSSATDHLDDIEEIVKKDIDAIAFQEVQPGQVKDLADNFPRWHINYVITDGRSRPAGGGNHANVLMTRQKPKEVEAFKIDGSGNAESIIGRLEGLAVDAASASGYLSGTKSPSGPTTDLLHNTKEKVQEHRAVLALTLEIGTGKNKRDMRLMTTHISANQSVHVGQLDQAIKITKKNVKDDRPTVLCGDLNANETEIIPKFSQIGGFIIDRTSSTSDEDETLDYCAYNEAGLLGLGTTRVLKKYMTDHHPIVIRWDLDDRG